LSGSKKGSRHESNHRWTLSRPKIFLIAGIRHSAVVIANNESEALKLATEDSTSGPPNPNVL
jgi:hypothetical protein